MLVKPLRLFAFLAVLLVAINCSYKPPDNPNARPGQGFNLFPVWYDNMLGEQYADIYRQELPVLTSARIYRSVHDLGMHLVRTYYADERPPFRFEFHVVNLDVMNAFALPGGKIFVFRGLMEDIESESELAAVIAHEMGHAVARHGTKNISRGIAYQSLLLTGTAILSQKKENLAALTYIAGSIGVSLAMLKYSRDYEREADWIALHNIYKAGYDPEGLVTLFQRFEKARDEKGSGPSLFLQSHPAPEERQKNIVKELSKIDLSRQWTEDQFGFSSIQAELKSLPPAPREIAGKSVQAMNSLESMGRMITESRAERLQMELATSNSQTVRIYVPSNEDWIDTGIKLRAGQTLELKVESYETTETTGPVQIALAQNEESVDSIEIRDSHTVEISEPCRLFVGVSDSDYIDNTGWYILETRIKN